MRTKLMKIKSARFGFGGYQECVAGLSLEFITDGTGVSTFIGGGWTMERSDRSQWTEEDRVKANGNMVAEVIKTLKDANVEDVSKLVGKPVECTFDGNTLKSWRILTEVI